MNSDQAGWYLQQLQRCMDAELLKEALEFEFFPTQATEVTVRACQCLGVQVNNAAFCLHYLIVFEGQTRLPQYWYGEITQQGEAQKVHAGDVTRRICPQLHSDVDLFISLQSLNLLLRPKGVDEHLLGLELLHNPEYALDAIGPLFGVSDIHAVQTELVDHQLGDHAVVRFLGAHKKRWVSLLSVVYQGEHDTFKHFQNLQGLAAQLESTGNSSGLAAPIAHLSNHNMIVIQDVPEARSGENCLSESFYRSAGVLLRSLHNSPIEDCVSALEAKCPLFWSDYIAAFLPNQKRNAFLVGELVQQEMAALPPATSRLIHGSYGLSALVEVNQKAMVRYLTTLGVGDVAQDLGCFLASAQLSRMIHGAMDSGLSWAFLSGYSEADDSMRYRIIAFQRLALYELAFKLALWRDKQDLVEALLQTALSPAD
ncbi:MAG: hypothetical protein AAF438_04345 [Pseudomonadota bacterium]